MEQPRNAQAEANKANIERVKAYFEPRPILHGDSHRAVDWGSQKSQFARFAALNRLAPLQQRSLLDVGCGLGHLLDWMADQGITTHYYEGLDVTPSMVKAARHHYPGIAFKECNLLEGDLPDKESYEIVFASGIFYLALDEPYAYLSNLLDCLYSLTQQVLVFNLLIASKTDSSILVSEGEFRATIDRIIGIVSKLSPYFSLDHAYHESDATIAVYRQPR